jgi:hypothetical protein
VFDGDWLYSGRSIREGGEGMAKGKSMRKEKKKPKKAKT